MRPKLFGSAIGAVFTAGVELAATVPRTVIVPVASPPTVIAVGWPAATVFTDESIVYADDAGRDVTTAGWPGLVGLVTMSTRLLLIISGVGLGSKGLVRSKGLVNCPKVWRA